jgi:hypothetical protein
MPPDTRKPLDHDHHGDHREHHQGRYHDEPSPNQTTGLAAMTGTRTKICSRWVGCVTPRPHYLLDREYPPYDGRNHGF